MIVRITNATVARGGIPVLALDELVVKEGERILLTGENGAGKSSLLLFLAGKIHPYENKGRRDYAHEMERDFRTFRRSIALVSREEELRLRKIHAGSSVKEFLLGHYEGEDFLYRAATALERARIDSHIDEWGLEEFADKKIKTLSLGEFRLVQVARAALHERTLYLLDEIFSSLSETATTRVASWLKALPSLAAVVLTSHDEAIRHFFYPNRILHIEKKRVIEVGEHYAPLMPKLVHSAVRPNHIAEPLIECRAADFYHDFQPVLHNITFTLQSGDRILLTGENGSGKTTLLRVMHGDFYPAFGQGSLRFLGALNHEHKGELWQKVQLVAASQFDYFPPSMRVENVLASRLSGSLYDYAPTLPDAAIVVVREFGLYEFLPRLFKNLSEGEKTRVLFCRAFLEKAPVYLIDEGFMALSERFFSLVAGYLNQLPVESVVVIAANERLSALQQRLQFPLQRWRMERGRLTILP